MPTSIPESFPLIRAGWVGTGPFSFYGRYTRLMNQPNKFAPDAYNPLNIRVTHIWGDDYRRNYRGSAEYVKKWMDYWTGDEQSPEAIARDSGIPNVCDDYHDMVDEIDGAMIMDFDRAYELSEPFLRAGKPIFLCSPVAVSVPECRRILDLAAANNAAVYSGSFTATVAGNESAYARVKRDDIASYFATTSFHYYTSYANDGLEPVHWFAGPGVKRVSLHGWDGSSGYDPEDVPQSRIHLEYEPRDGNPPIQGTLSLGGNTGVTTWFRAYYRNHAIFEEHAPSYAQGLSLNFRDFMFRIQETFATNRSPETHEDIIQKLRVVIAAYKSANEGGRPVDVDEIGDYRMPTVRIEHWDRIP